MKFTAYTFIARPIFAARPVAGVNAAGWRYRLLKLPLVNIRPLRRPRKGTGAPATRR